MGKRRVVIGFLGTSLDAGKHNRWERWRPTVAVCQHEDMVVDRIEIIHDNHSETLAQRITADIAQVSPETEARRHVMNLKNPWDFGEVYAAMHDFARAYPFDPDHEEYLVNITTGTASRTPRPFWMTFAIEMSFSPRIPATRERTPGRSWAVTRR